MRVAVIGAGASGLTAAGSVRNAEVVIFDHSEKAGKKIYITGKGRCNFTNLCESQEFLQNVVTNARFLRGAIYRFTPQAAIDLLEANGCAAKVERGRRVFPVSDKASDVIKALQRYAAANGAQLRLNAEIAGMENRDGRFIIDVDGAPETFDKVIVCTGGASYPSTGSDGSFYKVIEALGHTVIKPAPSLVALVTKEDLSSAEGLTLKNVAVEADGVKPIFGDLMITDRGVSGPIILTLSALLARRETPYGISLDLKPALSREELDARLVRDFGDVPNKQFKNSLDKLLPKALIEYIIERSGIDPTRQVNSVTRAERRALCDLLKKFELTVVGNEGFERAVVTSGGVDVLQVDPRTMGSKLIDGLYFAGEALDVDALTGGYNFHIALATGYVAGSSAGGVQ